MVLAFYFLWSRRHSALNDGGDGLIPAAAAQEDEVVTSAEGSSRASQSATWPVRRPVAALCSEKLEWMLRDIADRGYRGAIGPGLTPSMPASMPNTPSTPTNWPRTRRTRRRSDWRRSAKESRWTFTRSRIGRLPVAYSKPSTSRIRSAGAGFGGRWKARAGRHRFDGGSAAALVIGAAVISPRGYRRHERPAD